ncbi:MAG: O-unit flippase-like protein [Bacteroidales bacterium]|nr:O-unit flippase-like protein [Bacteroidales bacterium]
MQITKVDATWNFIATGLRIASGIVVLPLILRLLPQEELALWTIFLPFGSMIYIMDFGFSQTFMRNITYIFSGANELRKEGFTKIGHTCEPNYSLLKGTIRSMNLFYGVLSFLFFLIVITAGTFYLLSILSSYPYNHNIILIAWALYVVVISVQLYTLSYDSLLQGRGMIRQNKKILILSQLTQIVVASACLIAGYGLISMVYGQLSSLIINRLFAHKAFYDKSLRSHLKNVNPVSPKQLLKIVSPNAVKVGITALGSFLVARSGVFIASYYLPLSDIASYGITQQVVDILAGLSAVWFNTFYPRITQFRLINDISGVKRLYIKSKIFYFILFGCGSVFLLLLGNPVLSLIDSKTFFVSAPLFALALFVALLSNNQAIATNMLLSKNEVPFFKASIISGLGTIALLFLFLGPLHMQLTGVFLAPGIVQSIYQNWKWPLLVNRELNIRGKDYLDVLSTFKEEITNTKK